MRPILKPSLGIKKTSFNVDDNKLNRIENGFSTIMMKLCPPNKKIIKSSPLDLFSRIQSSGIEKTSFNVEDNKFNVPNNKIMDFCSFVLNTLSTP